MSETKVLRNKCNIQLTLVSIRSNSPKESFIRDILGGGFARRDRALPLADDKCLRHLLARFQLYIYIYIYIPETNEGKNIRNYLNNVVDCNLCDALKQLLYNIL